MSREGYKDVTNEKECEGDTGDVMDEGEEVGPINLHEVDSGI